MNRIASMADGQITLRKAAGTWVVRAEGSVIAESANALELTEPGRAPVIYFPRGDVAMAFLEAGGTGETRIGSAQLYSVVSLNKTLPDAAWSYETPAEGLDRIAGHLAFHATDEVMVEQL